MSKFFDNLSENLKDRLKEFGPEVGAEAKRMGRQGAMELAAALFNGSGFVPYGPGAYRPPIEHGKSQEATHDHERGGMER